MRKVILLVIRYVSSLFIAVILFIVFFVAQRYNYSLEDQVYFMGTKAGYGIVFVFLFVTTIFVFHFIKHRNNAPHLKKMFFIFSGIYLLSAPLVVLSFDNYLIVTKNGLNYNRFFQLDSDKVRQWKEIEKVNLDYQVKERPWDANQKMSIQYIILFDKGPVINLNHPNSPLYHAEEFQAIHHVIMEHKIPIETIKPFPEELKDTHPFHYQFFQQHESHQQ